MVSWFKGDIMHKYPKSQSYEGSSGQTLTTNVSMTLGDWQICLLMWSHLYQIKLGTKLIQSLRPL